MEPINSAFSKLIRKLDFIWGGRSKTTSPKTTSGCWQRFTGNDVRLSLVYFMNETIRVTYSTYCMLKSTPRVYTVTACRLSHLFHSCLPNKPLCGWCCNYTIMWATSLFLHWLTFKSDGYVFRWNISPPYFSMVVLLSCQCEGFSTGQF